MFNYEKLSAEEILLEIIKWNKTIVFASSFGAEDQVITHILKNISSQIEIFTIDTKLLPLETLKLKNKTESIYQFKYIVYQASIDSIIGLIKEQGEQGFYNSLEKRKRCCEIRKLEPLKTALLNVNGWITGLRREQSSTRKNIKKIEIDNENNGILKINPLADWSEMDIWNYIKKYNIPYNELHDRGYPSIGCFPCTRAICDGESVRDGRWWWEENINKECGLHTHKKETNNIVKIKSLNLEI